MLSQDLARGEINHPDGVSMDLSNQDRHTADGIAVVIVITGCVVNLGVAATIVPTRQDRLPLPARRAGLQTV